MKTKLVGGTLLFVLMLPIISLFGQAQETNHVADKFNPVQSGAVPVAEATAQFEATKAKAENGDAQAQYNLAGRYASGRGVARDDAEAVKWCRKAADQNYAEAQNSMGDYFSNWTEARNEAEALKWYRKAAEQGFAEAEYNLGRCYFSGKGVAKNGVEANKWFRRAAEHNYAAAQYMLGLAYAEGDDAPKDYVEAYKWVLLAATNGYENAQQYIYMKQGTLEDEMSPEQIAEGQKLASEFKPRIAPKPGTAVSGSDLFDSRPLATGTAFFISDDGFLISNAHVIEDATQIRLVTSAGLLSAKIVKVDAANDLALLKADGQFAPLPIAASRTVNLGSTVATIGFPDIGLQGFAPKLAKGEIASLSGAGDDPRYFQISVPVQPGNSGGALVDERGNVVGIVAAKLDASAALAASGQLPENVNYAVKSSLLLSFLESVPDVDAKLKTPNTNDEKFEDVVKAAQNAAVLVLVY